MSQWLPLTIIPEEEALIEPHTGDDKRATTGQPFGGAGFEVTSLDNPVKEQLNGFAPGGVSGLDTVILNPEDLQHVKATYVHIWNTTLSFFITGPAKTEKMDPISTEK
jgi:hypothetical protein